ncbi:mechanosensitive ion channel domain-containing protein [Ancylobacter sp. G4_0304]|uniref:mechanosensitive ion channel domain-containing protein n=1 Tax=Ancylobacter sp. G4_0304 TaxID=3114289 RepID=UPI0039C65FF5
MLSLRPLLLAMVLALAPAGALVAQSQPAPAPGAATSPLTPQQFDQLVDSLSRAVAERLRQEGAATAVPAAPAATTPETPRPHAGSAPAAPSPAAPMMEMTEEAPFTEMVVDVLGRSDDVLAELPGVLDETARIPALLRAEINNGREPSTFVLIVLGCLVGVLALEVLLRLALRGPRRHLAGRVVGTSSLWALTGLVSLDIAILAVVWLAVHAVIVGLFGGPEPQARLGFLLLTSLFNWRLYMLAFRVTLRPGLPQARLADVDDAGAARLYYWASAVLFVAIALNDGRRVLEGIQSPPLVVAGVILLNTAILTALLLVAATALRQPMAQWLNGLVQGGRSTPLVATLARFWLCLAIPAFLILGVARVYGALTTSVGIQNAILMTMNVLLALLILESFMDRVCRLMRADLRPETTARERAIEAVMRCVRVAILLGAVSLLFRTWAVSGMGMMDMSGYNAIAAAALPAGAILFAAYCAWQAVEYFTGLHGPAPAGPAVPGLHDTEEMATGASRMSTLMPLLRVTALLTIIVIAVLTVLSQLGINITPLIAGASIVGLAISFGSQTLVKDIVSGVFYLVDDAFRVGEYIDCGRAKGTVEGFTLRSIRLRHQNGMVHTIPFGQLGQITNFSRDWATLKFNLRFTRDTDLEKLRKAVKKIGIELQEDPEYKEDFLMPLKMQGVTDIADNALVVRFKLTVKPVRPTVVQREAIKRMVRILPEQGIEFANNTVAVRTEGSGDPGGAAAAIQQRQVANDLAEKAAADAAAS